MWWLSFWSLRYIRPLLPQPSQVMNALSYHLLLIFDKLGVKQQEGTFGGHGKVLYLECGHDYKIEILKNASHYIFKRCILLYINDISIKFFKLRNRVTNEALMDYMDAKLCKLYTKNLKCLLKWFRRLSLLKMALLQRTWSSNNRRRTCTEKSLEFPEVGFLVYL